MVFFTSVLSRECNRVPKAGETLARAFARSAISEYVGLSCRGCVRTSVSICACRRGRIEIIAFACVYVYVRGMIPVTSFGRGSPTGGWGGVGTYYVNEGRTGRDLRVV